MVSSSLAILTANSSDGLYFAFSNRIIVSRRTPTRFAKSYSGPDGEAVPRLKHLLGNDW